MKTNLFTKSLILLAAIALVVGCSNNSADTEPAPKGVAPEAKQADPGMKSPEERARGASGGGEGS